MSDQAQAAFSIAEALRKGAVRLSEIDTGQLDARILMKHVLQTDDAGLIARANEAMKEEAAAHFFSLVERRAAHEPVAYITGVKEFWSLEFHVTPDVLIPRDDSGALIEAAMKRRGRDEGLRIADLGTGSGCLLCALLNEFPKAQGVGVDCSMAALDVAMKNAAALNLSSRARFIAGDWLAPLTDAYDIIVANPPYIPEGDRPGLMRDVAIYEPAGALFAGADGLDAYRAILPGLRARLAPDGLVLMECGADQTDSLAALMGEYAPIDEIFTLKDLAGRPRGAGFDLRKAKKRD